MSEFCPEFRIVGSALLVALLVTGCASPPLHKAVAAGDTSAVKQALEGGASADGSTWHGRPIGIAVANDDLATLKLLHENGGEISPQQLNVAVQLGAKTTYRYLTENGADIESCFLNLDNANSGEFYPPLGWAIARSDIDSVNLLLSLGAPVETDCVKFNTWVGYNYTFAAILTAAVFGNSGIIESLISSGAVVNRLTTEGRTPISLAAEHGHYEAVRILLANGAFHSYTTELKQPIEYAIEADHNDTVDLLAYAGAVRPQRTQPLAHPENSGSTFWEGVKLVAELYVVYLGSRYSDYDPDYMGDGDDSGSRNSQRSASSNSCRHDNNCGAYEICAKPYGSLNGTCVRDATNSGKLSTSYGVGPSNRGHGVAGTCPTGYERDLIYGGCKK